MKQWATDNSTSALPSISFLVSLGGKREQPLTFSTENSQGVSQDQVIFICRMLDWLDKSTIGESCVEVIVTLSAWVMLTCVPRSGMIRTTIY